MLFYVHFFPIIVAHIRSLPSASTPFSRPSYHVGGPATPLPLLPIYVFVGERESYKYDNNRITLENPKGKCFLQEG